MANFHLWDVGKRITDVADLTDDMLLAVALDPDGTPSLKAAAASLVAQKLGALAGAPRWIGPWTIYALQNQTIAFAADAGTATYIFNGEETAAIAPDAVAADYTTAFEALPSVGAGKMPFTGSPGTLSCVIDLSIIPTLIVTGTNSLSLSSLIDAQIASGGANYQQFDILSIGTAQIQVDTVDGGGAVTSVSITAPGSGQTTATGVLATGGNGSGATFDTTAATNPATPDIYVSDADLHREAFVPSANDLILDLMVERIERFGLNLGDAQIGLIDATEEWNSYALELWNVGNLIHVSGSFSASGARDASSSALGAAAGGVDAMRSAYLPVHWKLPDTALQIYVTGHGGSGCVTGIVKAWIQIATPVAP